MESINLHGKGFIGSRYAELTPNVTINARNDYNVYENNIVYTISTTDNYNVIAGNPFIDIDTNLTRLIHTLEAVREYKAKYNVTPVFNFISSWYVYGRCGLNVAETAPCNPEGFYSITKRTAEQLIEHYCGVHEIDYRILRLGNVIGPNDNPSPRKNALQYLLNTIKSNQYVLCYNPYITFRDYIHVDDVVSAINLVIEKGDLNTIYNIGNGHPVYLKDLLNYAKHATNSTSKIEYRNTEDISYMYLNVAKLKKLGYKPKYSIYKAINTLL